MAAEFVSRLRQTPATSRSAGRQACMSGMSASLWWGRVRSSGLSRWRSRPRPYPSPHLTAHRGGRHNLKIPQNRVGSPRASTRTSTRTRRRSDDRSPSTSHRNAKRTFPTAFARACSDTRHRHRARPNRPRTQALVTTRRVVRRGRGIGRRRCRAPGRALGQVVRHCRIRRDDGRTRFEIPRHGPP
jgi:hypothetical protein